ncbi:MAG: hypothetical protein ACKPKO_54295, partial [Candidatus Fonsibacter sp.]
MTLYGEKRFTSWTDVRVIAPPLSPFFLVHHLPPYMRADFFRTSLVRWLARRSRKNFRLRAAISVRIDGI